MARESPPTILFAEDSEDDRLLFELGFEERHTPFNLQFVEDGVMATDYLCGKPPYDDREKYPAPFVLLTDLKMPRMDGLELLAWIRSQPDWHALPVIVFTGSNREEDRLKALHAGATSYVVKDLLMRPPPSLIEGLLRFAPGHRRRAISRLTHR